MSFKCIKIQKFSGPKDSSLINMYCVCAQGAALLQEGVSLRIESPSIFWVTVWVEAMDAECLWCPKSTFALDRPCPVTLTGDSCKVFKWNPAGLKGQWWKMMSVGFSFPGHRFFSVVGTILSVSPAGMEFAFLHWGIATSSTERNCWSNSHVHCTLVHWRLCYSYWKCLL